MRIGISKFKVGDIVEYLALYKDGFQVIPDNRIVLKTGRILKIKNDFKFFNTRYIIQESKSGFIYTIAPKNIIDKVKLKTDGGNND